MKIPDNHTMLARDADGTVYNSQRTFTGLARMLNRYGSVFIAWTDEQGSQLDLLLTVQPIQVGPIAGGLQASTHLFVSVIRFGAFGFQIKKGGSHRSPHDVSEKLHTGDNLTTNKLVRLIDGTCEALQKELGL